MWLSLSFVMVEVARVDPPAGGLSPLAWTLIIALSGVISAAVPALWLQNQKMYRDLKECNEIKNQQDEEVLGVLKVVRLQMEQSRGGRPR